MAEGDYNVRAIISAETSRFENGMKNAQKSLDGVSKSIGNVSNLLKTAFSVAGVSIGVNTFVNALKSIDTEASESSKQLKLLSNTVKITGAATWTSAKQMNELAESISKNTNYSVNDIRKMETVLLGFKNITGETFTEASNAITDMATVMGMDLTSAVQTVGKALDDPIKGLDSLRRQGFAFTDEQKKELEQLVKNGKQMQAQKIILDELATTYGGAAKKAADSGEQLENNIKNLKAELGKSWDGSIEPVKKAANVLIERWTEAIKKINEANDAVKNLKKVISSAGEIGDVSDAKTLQAAKNVQLQKEYRDISRFAEIAGKELKKRSKEEKEIYAEMMAVYGLYVQKYQDEGMTLVEAIKKVQEDKKAEWAQGLNDFQMIVEKEKQLEKEREEAQKAAADEETIARRKALTDAYDETIAKAKEEIEIRRSMGEKISEEAEQIKILEVMKSAYLKMIEDSNGEMKEEAVRLQQIIKLQNKLNQAIEETGEASENQLSDFMSAWETFKGEFVEEASSWSDFFLETFQTFKELGTQAVEAVGAALVEGEDAWQNLGAVALESIAQILEGLAKELVARAALLAASQNYAAAAAAAAGAAVALVGAGALKAIASNMKKISKDTQTLVDALKDLKKELKSIESAGSAGKISNIASAYAQSVNAVKEAQSALSQKATNETYEVYLQSLGSYTKAVNSLDESLKELNNTLDLQAKAFRDIYSATDKVSKNIVKNKVLSDLKTQLDTAYSDIENIGKTIGETMFNGIAEGATTSTFLTDVKKYIVNAMTKIAVFTESFQKQLADATSGMLVGITTGDNSIIENSTKAIKNLYETALSTASAIEGSITGIFNNIDTKTNATVRSLKETIDDVKKEGFTDLSKTLLSRSNLTQQISEAKSKLDKALSDYQSSSIPNAIYKLKYKEKASYTRQRNELQDAINSYSEKIIELNKQRESLEWTVGHSAPFSLYRGEEKFQEYLYWLSRNGRAYDEQDYASKKYAADKANISVSWAEEKWNWEMAKRDLEDVNSAINTYQNLIKNTTPRIDEYNEKIKETDSKISELNSEYKNLENAYKKADDEYQEALGLINKSMRELSDNLKAQNKELDNQILLYKELYTSTDASFNSAVLETSLNKIKSAFYSFFEDLQDMGLTVGENLVNAIADGMSQADFLTSMKDYIRKAIIQTVVYTETLQHEIAQIGATISKGIAEGFTDTGLHEIKRDLSYIFYMAQNSISKIDTVLDNVFSGYATGTQNATRGLHLVGEAGPELVRFRGGEQVLNAGNTQKALSGSGTTINQNVTFNNLNDTSAFAMMQQFKRYNREMAINSVL